MTSGKYDSGGMKYDIYRWQISGSRFQVADIRFRLEVVLRQAQDDKWEVR
jgi:hypothetical protein